MKKCIAEKRANRKRKASMFTWDTMDPSVPFSRRNGFLFFFLFSILQDRLSVRKEQSVARECKWRAAHVFPSAHICGEKLVREVHIRRVAARVQPRDEQVFFALSLSHLLSCCLSLSPITHTCYTHSIGCWLYGFCEKICRMNCFAAHEHRSPHTWSLRNQKANGD